MEIPRPNSTKTRPLTIASFSAKNLHLPFFFYPVVGGILGKGGKGDASPRDKIVQKAVQVILQAI